MCLPIFVQNFTTDMDKFIEKFPTQMLDAVALTAGVNLSKRAYAIENILVCGLGGSGIAGNLAFDLTATQLSVPLLVNKGYELPSFVNIHTLLVLCSYSGNTEETLSCCQQAIARGLRPICIASGGRLKELAQAQGFDFIQLPTGFPPRTTLGYGATILLFILDHFGLIDLSVMEVITAASEMLSAEQENIKKASQSLAKVLRDKTIIIYVENSIESVALRLKQQINENAKANCWYNVIPELNHNELVGWKFKNDTLAGLFLRTDYEHKRNQLRFEFVYPIVADHVHSVHELQAKGSTLLEQYFYHVHFGDWLSYYLAIEHQQDPVEVKIIDKLKAHLASVDA